MDKATKKEGLEEFPDKYLSFNLDKELTIEEFERLAFGFIPKQSEDKWYIYVEDYWIYFHRSWSGRIFYKTTNHSFT